jgi:hypothetical protein
VQTLLQLQFQGNAGHNFESDILNLANKKSKRIPERRIEARRLTRRFRALYLQSTPHKFKGYLQTDGYDAYETFDKIEA